MGETYMSLYRGNPGAYTWYLYMYRWRSSRLLAVYLERAARRIPRPLGRIAGITHLHSGHLFRYCPLARATATGRTQKKAGDRTGGYTLTA